MHQAFSREFQHRLLEGADKAHLGEQFAEQGRVRRVPVRLRGGELDPGCRG